MCSGGMRGLHLLSSVHWLIVEMACLHRPSHVILADVKRLAVEYYAATGKPLSVTGELAECEAAHKLGLDWLTPALLAMTRFGSSMVAR